MVKRVHLVLPQKISINWLTPWFAIFKNELDISYEIIEVDHSFAVLKNKGIKLWLWLESKYYNFKYSSYKGFSTIDLLPTSILHKKAEEEKDILVLNFSAQVKYPTREYHIGYGVWFALINQIIGYKILNSGVMSVFWSKGKQSFIPSYIQEKTILTEQIQSYFFKLSLDGVVVSKFTEQKYPIEQIKHIGFSQLLILFFKRLFTRAKKGKWVLSLSLNGQRPIIAKPLTKNTIWADPFVFKKNGKSYLLYEEMKCKKKGEIAIAKVIVDGIKPLKIILSGDTHFSYPFIIEHNHRLFVLPENAENKAVNLYELDKESLDIKNKIMLINNIELYDSTLVYHNKLWYLFGNKRNGELNSFNDDLYIYYSDDPFSSKWNEHTQNPVIRDVRSSRPAGQIFKREGFLIRPAQNNAFYYGKSLVLNKILELTPHIYREKVQEIMIPPNEYIGLHTYNFNDEVTVTDLLLTN